MHRLVAFELTGSLDHPNALHGLPAVQPTRLAALAHKDAVVVVDADLGAEQLDQIGQGVGVVDEFLASQAPLRDAAGAPQAILGGAL